jgi:hypothetical protein
METPLRFVSRDLWVDEFVVPPLGGLSRLEPELHTPQFTNDRALGIAECHVVPCMR